MHRAVSITIPNSLYTSLAAPGHDGSPDLGEGSSRAHACTTKNARRERGLDYGCTCMCGHSRGCPTSNGDKQAIRLTHRVHTELWTSGPQLVTGTIPPAANMTTGQWTVWMGMGLVSGWSPQGVLRPQANIHYIYIPMYRNCPEHQTKKAANQTHL